MPLLDVLKATPLGEATANGQKILRTHGAGLARDLQGWLWRRWTVIWAFRAAVLPSQPARARAAKPSAADLRA